jgi:ABC-type uncharacterized transport system auxiliary subunit
MSTASRSLLSLLLLFGLSACTLLDVAPTSLALYDLTPPALEAAGDKTGRSAPSLAIGRPEALRPTASARIATRDDSGALGVLAAAAWVAPAPILLQSLLVESFEARLPGAAISRVGSGAQADCRLEGDLHDFLFDQVSQRVRLTLNLRLLCGARGEIVAARRFGAEAPVEHRGTAALIAAFDRVVAMAFPEVMDWTIQALEADASRGRS